jgi:TusA-related sulfurtransferase
MQANKKLDLCGMLNPYCLLMFKSALASMEPGDVLEVQVRDPETLGDLLTILERSAEAVVARAQRDDRTCLWIQKGKSTRPACWSKSAGVDPGSG